jgi:hypothetical protein
LYDADEDWRSTDEVEVEVDNIATTAADDDDSDEG